MIAIALALTSPAVCSGDTGLLALYAGSSLVGMHSHKVGPDGRMLELAEQAFGRKREASATRLAMVCGRAAVDEVDQAIFEQSGNVYYTSGPTEDEEYDRLYRASSALRRLDRQLRREERR